MAAVCDPFVAYCSVPLGAPTCDPGASTDGDFSLLFRNNTNSIDFDAEGSLLGTELPLIIEGDEPWNGLEFVLEPRDCLGSSCGTDFSIDQVIIDIDIPVGTSSTEQRFTGNAGIACFDVSYLVRCAVDHYGGDCTRECTNFVSCEGCGLPGLTAEFCQFSTVNCSEVYCNDNQVCVDGSPTCDCEPGYTGDRCEVDINNCEGEDCSGNGRCEDRVNSFVCVCEPGFTGDLCEQLILTGVPTNTTTSHSTEDQATESDASAPHSGLAVAGGVVGGIVFVVLIVIIVLLLFIIILQRKQNSNYAVMQQATDQEMITMTQNQLYGVRTAEEDIKMEPVYETLEEKMEMTQN